MATLPKPQISPTGLTLWPLSDNQSLIWAGTGSRLYLGLNATKPGGAMIPIEHESANGSYATRKDAAKAALAFLTVSEDDPSA